jgi:hypothetical protein
MDAAEFVRWYGAWSPPEPAMIAQIMAGLAAPWWIAGGWAIEAFTGQSRVHEDSVVALFRAVLPSVLDHLLPTYCVWSNLNGMLRPLRTPAELVDECRQLWVRRDALSPWMIDLLLTPHDGDTWISVRDPAIRRPFTEAVAHHDGLPYLRPEMALHLKARLHRPKDERDFRAAYPRLDATARMWLRSALERADPGHPWLDDLAVEP